MTIVHTAYLCAPAEFSAQIEQIIIDLGTAENCYKGLRAFALETFRTNPEVRVFASEYGGWDELSIKTQFPIEQPEDISDVSFWFLLLLFDHLSLHLNGGLPLLGIGANYRVLERILNSLGWNNDEIIALTHGRDATNLFPDLSERPYWKTISEIQNYREHVKPYSINGLCGWLNEGEIDSFRQRLEQNREDFLSIRDVTDVDSMQLDISKLYETTISMLVQAQHSRKSLCYLISG